MRRVALLVPLFFVVVAGCGHPPAKPTFAAALARWRGDVFMRATVEPPDAAPVTVSGRVDLRSSTAHLHAVSDARAVDVTMTAALIGEAPTGRLLDYGVDSRHRLRRFVRIMPNGTTVLVHLDPPPEPEAP